MQPSICQSGWFAVLRGLMGFPVPLTDEDGDIILFPTENECRLAAKSSFLGSKHGFQVYSWDSSL